LASLYRVPNIRYDAYLVYTNKAFGGAMRGFGNPQISFAMESQLDMIAEKLKMDPLDLRLKNAVKSGDVSATKWKITSCGFSECLEKSAEAANWKTGRSGSKKDGLGIAGMMHHIGFRAGFCDSSSAFVKIRNDNRVYVLSGASDVGQGSNTALAQIVAEELGLSLDDIVVAPVDTNYSPMDMGTYASRVTVYAGNAVKAAASDLKNQIMEAVAMKLRVVKEDLEIRDRRVYVKEAPEKGLSFEDAILACQEFGKGMELLGKGYYDPPTEVIDLNTGYGNYSITYPFGATVAQVSVDTETGEVKVKKLFAAYDIGRAINPISVEGQIQGACAMGLGYTLSEEIMWENGKILNPNFGDYRMPTAADMPQIEPILVEPVDPDGPFGGKGMAEAALVPIAPAVANAIYNAVGVRIKELPITPEKILKALKNSPR
jgi:CO/xanthine dehydrogenase Mo-binding subunit